MVVIHSVLERQTLVYESDLQRYLQKSCVRGKHYNFLKYKKWCDTDTY